MAPLGLTELTNVAADIDTAAMGNQITSSMDSSAITSMLSGASSASIPSTMSAATFGVPSSSALYSSVELRQGSTYVAANSCLATALLGRCCRVPPLA